MNEQIHSKPLLMDDFDYHLPAERIANYPLSERDASKLLVFQNGEITETRFSEISTLLPKNALLVRNNTRVIHARLIFSKPTGARIEIFCLEPVNPSDHALSLSSTDGCEWECLVGNLKKWKADALAQSVVIGGETIRFTVEKTTESRVRFAWNNAAFSFSEILEACGELPIPPYLNRAAETADEQTYQTVYAKAEGSVAAPTAGLHFTDGVLNTLKTSGIETAEVTLHVGAGTFRPVKSAHIEQHDMHTEAFSISLDAVRQISEKLGNIVAVGTTSVCTLESLYYIGALPALATAAGDSVFHVEQWAPYQTDNNAVSTRQALRNIIDFLEKNRLETLRAETQILIKPGFRFRLIRGMITNFHQPRSTLLLLVAAFAGNGWKTIYDHALANGFRFLSYGDSSLLLK